MNPSASKSSLMTTNTNEIFQKMCPTQTLTSLKRLNERINDLAYFSDDYTSDMQPFKAPVWQSANMHVCVMVEKQPALACGAAKAELLPMGIQPLIPCTCTCTSTWPTDRRRRGAKNTGGAPVGGPALLRTWGSTISSAVPQSASCTAGTCHTC